VAEVNNDLAPFSSRGDERSRHLNAFLENRRARHGDAPRGGATSRSFTRDALYRAQSR
jgi:hypothetical protein